MFLSPSQDWNKPTQVYGPGSVLTHMYTLAHTHIYTYIHTHTYISVSNCQRFSTDIIEDEMKGLSAKNPVVRNSLEAFEKILLDLVSPITDTSGIVDLLGGKCEHKPRSEKGDIIAFVTATSIVTLKVTNNNASICFKMKFTFTG